MNEELCKDRWEKIQNLLSQIDLKLSWILSHCWGNDFVSAIGKEENLTDQPPE